MSSQVRERGKLQLKGLMSKIKAAYIEYAAFYPEGEPQTYYFPRAVRLHVETIRDFAIEVHKVREGVEPRIHTDTLMTPHLEDYVLEIEKYVECYCEFGNTYSLNQIINYSEGLIHATRPQARN